MVNGFCNMVQILANPLLLSLDNARYTTMSDRYIMRLAIIKRGAEASGGRKHSKGIINICYLSIFPQALFLYTLYID